MSRAILKATPKKGSPDNQSKPPLKQTYPKEGEPHPTTFHRLYTIREAAEVTGLKYWLLLRAVKSGDVPSYQFSNARRRVRLPDIEATIALAGENRGRAR